MTFIKIKYLYKVHSTSEFYSYKVEYENSTKPVNRILSNLHNLSRKAF